MTRILTCAALVCAGAFAAAQTPTERAPADKAINFDGTWSVVACDKQGQAVADCKDMVVTAKDNTFTCAGKDGKAMMTMKFEFTGLGHAKVTYDEIAAVGTVPADRSEKAGTREAIYVQTGDYLAVCIHDDKAADAKVGGKSACTILLKRATR